MRCLTGFVRPIRETDCATAFKSVFEGTDYGEPSHRDMAASESQSAPEFRVTLQRSLGGPEVPRLLARQTLRYTFGLRQGLLARTSRIYQLRWKVRVDLAVGQGPSSRDPQLGTSSCAEAPRCGLSCPGQQRVRVWRTTKSHCLSFVAARA
jgi:hypothetical protein